MTGPQFARAVAACDTVLLPLASIEQGGRHCPLGAGLIAAEAVACRIADAADRAVAESARFIAGSSAALPPTARGKGPTS
jgi:creatinine amidohydrolase/Fe(II)-dependent formamide hydrolase-like protein